MGEKSFSKSITVLVLISTLLAQHALGQFSDDFSDGNLTEAPAWSGAVNNFIVNGSQRLQLNALAAGSSTLTVPFAIPPGHNTVWEFFVSHGFASSVNNNSRIYLMSDTETLTGPVNGYFVQFGENGALDAVQLFRQSGNIVTSIIRGPDGDIDQADFTVRVRITRSAIGEWQLFIDATGGTSFSPSAVVSDDTFSSGNFFGIRCLYTIANINKFFFDDFSVSTVLAPDVQPPQLENIETLTSNEIELIFSEPLDGATVLVPTDFILNDTIHAISASFLANDSSIRLTFNEAMVNGLVQQIHFPSLSDVAGNTLVEGNRNFLFFQPTEPHAHDIVLSELHPDPSPSLGLPSFEFIELFNVSDHPFQLSGWELTDGTSHGIFGSHILLPQHYIIITLNDAVPLYAPYGTTIGVTNFPSLNNAGDNIRLKAPGGAVIDSLVYNLSTYRDDDKTAGGYTLERIDPTDFCKGAMNWKASEHSQGGTPGVQNSIHQITADLTGPKLLNIVPKGPDVVTLQFDERLGALPLLSDLHFPYPPQIVNAVFSNQDQSAIDISFSTVLDSATTYGIAVNNVHDCPGNLLQADFDSATFKVDGIAPTVISVTTTSQTQIEIVFNERLTDTSVDENAFTVNEYEGDITIGFSATKRKILLTFSVPLQNGREYLLEIANVRDASGNVIESTTYVIQYFEPEPVLPKDIVINEFMADPAPAIGLPEGEYIEIFNRSAKPFDLEGWTVTDGSSTATLPRKIILPGEHFILCSSGFASAYSSFGITLGLSAFPSLNNAGDMIKLVSADGITIDSIRFSSAWYQHDDKEDGGWAIERINPNDFCGESENWAAGSDPRGGTPGQVNSIFSLTADGTAPDLQSLEVILDDSVFVQFNERMSASIAAPENFQFVPAMVVAKAGFTDNTRRSVGLKLSVSIDSVTTYTLIATDIFDCPGNALHPDSAKVTFKLDNILPFVTSVRAIDAHTISVEFSEPVKFESLATKFSMEEVHPDKAEKSSRKSVVLSFSTGLKNGKSHSLSVAGVEDLAGNLITPSFHTVLHFVAHPVSRKDVIITEIFADPSPSQGLPETEYVEIYNRSGNAVQLDKWQLQDQNNTTKLPRYILLPEEHLVLTTTSKAFQFQNSLGISSFPTLTNAGEPLALRDSLGVMIDSLNYSDQWYRDSEKADGGWSLELIDLQNICAESENWTASEDPIGGTPGRENSVNAEKPDLTPPSFVSAIATSADIIVISFNEKLNTQIPSKASFTLNPPVEIEHVSFSDRSMRAYVLTLSGKLQHRVRYDLVLNGIADCAGNTIENHDPVSFALPEAPEPGDIVVNEILFNPRATGIDFVELFNRSEKYIDMKDWHLANFENDTLTNRKKIFADNFVFAPGDFLVLTSEPNTLKGEYLNSAEEKMRQTTLPPLSDDEGTLAILDQNENFIDTLTYNHEQHSPFLKDDEGVSLERIDVNAPASNRNNWQSASATNGYATPGLPNGSALQNVFDEAVSVYPEIFSPTSQPDFAMISYEFDQSDYVGNIKIVDAQGRVVREIAHNELLGTKGFYTWRGDTSQGGKATIGAYMVLFEAYDPSGNTVTIRKRVVLAERF